MVSIFRNGMTARNVHRFNGAVKPTARTTLWIFASRKLSAYTSRLNFLWLVLLPKKRMRSYCSQPRDEIGNPRRVFRAHEWSALWTTMSIRLCTYLYHLSPTLRLPLSHIITLVYYDDEILSLPLGVNYAMMITCPRKPEAETGLDLPPGPGSHPGWLICITTTWV